MSDTPRTDSAICNSDGQWSYPLRDTCRQLERELAEAREQRDELMEALEMIATHTYADGQCDNGYSPQYVAKQALSALKGGSDD